MPNTLKNLVNNNCVVLTANRRLATHLRNQYDQACIQQGEHCWQSIDILPITSWIERSWQSSVDATTIPTTTLLTPSQEQTLWSKIIQKSAVGDQLLNLAETARYAATAWALLKQWNQPITKSLFSMHHDSETFYHWAQEYQGTVRQKSISDRHMLADLLAQVINQKQWTPPSTIILAGFTELTPQYDYLLKQMKDVGCDIQDYQPQHEKHILNRIAITDSKEELVVMARWAKQLVSENSSLRIGCVIPNLTDLHNQASQVFTEVFAENEILANTAPFPFNISGGNPLASYALIHIALLITTLNPYTLDINKISMLLRTPFIGLAEKELSARATLDLKLRSNGEYAISTKHLLNQCRKSSPYLTKRLQQLFTLLKNRPKYAVPSEWVNFFLEALSLLGWPGERSLDSTEYQLLQRWKALLQEITRLDYLLASITYQEALAQLQQLAKSTIFQPQTNDTSVQVLGLLEAVGLPFDYLWVMGLHDGAWPPAARPNPFIPIQLQRKLKMPHSSAERELQFCQSLTASYTQNAANVIFSYPQQEDDRELRPSPLIMKNQKRPIVEITLNQLNLAPFESLADKLFNTKDIEQLEDITAPAITQDGPIKGGTFIFKHQAACPFRAYAYFRLGATSLQTPQAGLTPIARGTLLHAIMESIWRTLQTQQALCDSSEEELTALIDSTITEALSEVQQSHSNINQQFANIEKERLCRLVKTWLDKEKERPPFTVTAVEESHEVTIGGINLNLTIDRIDQLADGQTIIVDYKTGKTTIQAWFGERLDEPQLPLYAVTLDKPVSALSFAEINAETTSFKGIASEEIAIPGVKPLTALKAIEHEPSWDHQIAYWRKALNQLGEQFRQGNAKVDPKYPLKSCLYCDLHALCRIHEED